MVVLFLGDPGDGIGELTASIQPLNRKVRWSRRTPSTSMTSQSGICGLSCRCLVSVTIGAPGSACLAMLRCERHCVLLSWDFD